MKTKKPVTVIPEGASQIKKVLLCSLSKSTTTVQTAHNELKSLIAQLNSQQLPLLINLISETQDLSNQAKKEYLKVFSITAEIKGPELSEQVKKIIQIINKRILEGTSFLHQTIADTIGTLNECTIQRAEFPSDLLFSVINVLQNNFQHNNKIAQQVSAQALTKIIQTTHQSVLLQILAPYVERTFEILRSPICQSQCGLLESLLSLLLTLEQNYYPVADETYQVVLESLDVDEWAARKVGIDLIYTLAVIIPDSVLPYQDHLMQKLSDLRKDKIKQVREAAQVAIITIKDLSNHGENPQHHQSKSKPVKGRSIFSQAVNEEFFRQPKVEIEIKENNPKGQIDYQQDSPPRFQQHVESASPLITKYIINRSSATKSHNSQGDKFMDRKSIDYSSSIHQLPQVQFNINELHNIRQSANNLFMQDKMGKSDVDQLNQRLEYVERLIEHMYYHLMKNNLIPSYPGQHEKYQAQTAKFNFTQSDTDVLEQFEAVNSIQQQSQQDQHFDIPLRRSVYDKSAERISSSQGRLKPKEQFTSQSESNLKRYESFRQPLQSANLQDIYGQLLLEADEQQLVDMMLRTGPCCQQLDPSQVEFLLNKLRQMLLNNQNVLLAIEWIYDALLHHRAQFPDIQLKRLLDTLQKLDIFEGQKVIRLLQS